MSCELDIDNCREKFIDIILFADLNYVCIAASFVHDVSLADSISNGILEVNHRRPSWSLLASTHTIFMGSTPAIHLYRRYSNYCWPSTLN